MVESMNLLVRCGGGHHVRGGRLPCTYEQACRKTNGAPMAHRALYGD